MATTSSQRLMGPRHPFEEYTRMIVWYLESGQELDETLVQHGLGLLLVAKSDQDSMFRLLLASIKSCENDQGKQLRRALLRWAKGNQRAEAYPLVVLKAKTLSPDKVKSIVDHFLSIPAVEEEAGRDGSEGGDRLGGGEGDETAIHLARGLYAARWVTSSLVQLLEGRMVTVAVEERGTDAGAEAAPATVEAEEGESGGKLSELGIEKENKIGDDIAEESGEPEVNGKVDGKEGRGQVAVKSTSARPSVSGLEQSVEAEVLVTPDNGSFVRGRDSCGNASLKLEGKPAKSGLSEVVKSIVRKERGSMSGAKLDGLLITGARRVTMESDASVPGRNTKTVGVQTPRRNEIGEVRTQLEKLAATVENMALNVKGITAQQTMMERRLGRPLQRLKDVVEHKVVPSLQVVQNDLREHSQRLLRLEQGVRERNNEVGSLDAIPVARVVDPNVAASNSSSAVATQARRTSGISRREGMVIGRPRTRDDDSSSVMFREVFVMYDEDN